ncbi:hypothetical protein JG688_00016290, partial [Phytophthora aleatoria]
GSNAERAQCRHKAFAYQTLCRNPALFVTLTPNTDNSLVLARDVVNPRLPTTSELREASLRNASASARPFMRDVDAFIRHALSINPKTKKKMNSRFVW